MHKKSSIIVINGRRYDSGTGESITHDGHHSAGKPHAGGASGHRPEARHVAAHRPKPAQTLMRQAVKKPEDSLKRRIRVQSRLGSAAKPAAGGRILVKSGAHQPGANHLQNRATKRAGGQLISHFSPELFEVNGHVPAVTYGSAPVKRMAAHEAGRPASPRAPQTASDLLEYAVHHAPTPAAHEPARHRRRLFMRHPAASHR